MNPGFNADNLLVMRTPLSGPRVASAKGVEQIERAGSIASARRETRLE